MSAESRNVVSFCNADTFFIFFKKMNSTKKYFSNSFTPSHERDIGSNFFLLLTFFLSFFKKKKPIFAGVKGLTKNTKKTFNHHQYHYHSSSHTAPGDRPGWRRNTDGSLAARRHTDTETALKVARPRDPKKRWSNLEERSEVIARNIATLDGKRNPRMAVTVKV